MRKISKIVPTMPLYQKRKRVAAYARVSKDTERLTHSISAQVSYYSKLIQGNPEWEYAGVYADFAISGTGTDKRDEFKRLISDCEAGKIDIVLTKSISRFARNTVDLLETVRHLKGMGIEVRFEKEKIHSMSNDGELMLSILASFAQEEVHSLSENTKWGIRKSYEQGNDGVRNKKVLGYRYNGEKYVIKEEEAEIVRFIFEQTAADIAASDILEELKRRGAKTWRGYDFTYSHLGTILTNEIYIGDRRLQKCYVADPIKQNKVKNREELPQYYIADCHEPIIGKETFEKVQAILKARAEAVPTYPFTGKIKCAICGAAFTRKKGVTKGKTYIHWICRSKKETGVTCQSHNYSESKLHEICAELMETETFGEAAFEESVKGITALPDGSLEVHFYGGETRRWQMPPKPIKPPKVHIEKRPAHIFDRKIFCGICGRRFGRAISDTKDKHIYWRCRAKSNHGVTCDSVNYPDTEIKKIFCGIMGLEAFDEEHFLKTAESVVIQKSGSIDFHLQDGTVRKYETFKLRSNIHRTTSTDAFIGKIKCASCGNLYHRYSCYGKYVYWYCTGKTKVRTQCSGQDFADFNIRKVSAYIMGMDEFDEAEFNKQIEEIHALEDGGLEYKFYDGRAKRWEKA